MAAVMAAGMVPQLLAMALATGRPGPACFHTEPENRKWAVPSLLGFLGAIVHLGGRGSPSRGRRPLTRHSSDDVRGGDPPVAA